MSDETIRIKAIEYLPYTNNEHNGMNLMQLTVERIEAAKLMEKYIRYGIS